ncbi:MAG: ABC transporter ATP-binding protein [Chloroflexi bacterium]|nr:ABC transporter ATP-binding protein [Chloroflexota bacterium]
MVDPPDRQILSAASRAPGLPPCLARRDCVDCSCRARRERWGGHVGTIEAEGLTRRFGERLAVDGLSFAVEPGEVFGLLGPNGAGKTTTIGMLTCQLQPTAGTARLLGYDVRRDARRIKGLIGVVFEEQNLYERMSGRENLQFFASLYDVGRRRCDDVLDLVGLADRGDDRVARYSNGMRQRLLLARALLHQPRILFLDEPTRGLDPAAAREARTLIARLAAEGVTVLITTHDMDDADRLCHRVAIIDRGRFVAVDTPLALKLAHGRRMVRVLRRNAAEETMPLDPSPGAERLASLIVSGDVLAIHSEEATLEDAFLALTGRRLAE